jgi:hypothetical protein
VANSGQRCRWLCVGGADGGRFAAVLYGALDMELANMNPIDNDDDDDTQVYKRPWVGLTDDEVYKIAFALEGEHWRKIANAIEDKLREKNA